MKQVKNFAIAFAAMLAISSCSRDKNELQPVNPGERKLIKRSRIVGAPQTETYEYDAQGRITKQESEDELITFVYSGNTVVIKELRKTESNRQVALLTANLDAQGQIITAFGVTEYNAGHVLNTQRLLEYDAKGYIKTYKQVDNGTVEYKYEYDYANDNLVSIKYYTNGIYQHKKVIEYDLGKPDKIGFNSTWGIGYTFLAGLEGKTSKNLPIGAKLIYPNNTVSWSYTKSYEMDSWGYPVKMTIAGSGFDAVWDHTFDK